MILLKITIPQTATIAAAIQPILPKIDQSDQLASIVPNVYVIDDTKNEVNTQKRRVHRNLPLPISPFAAATAAKQGIVSILKAIKEMSAGTVIPVAETITPTS